MSVSIYYEDGSSAAVTPESMAELAGDVFAAAERVPGAAGEAFDLNAWYEAVAANRATEQLKASSPGLKPTHLIVRAADEFEAVIPWAQLGSAFFQFRVEGKPLTKGFPLRLYVPDGSSACLNVKSVVTIRLVSDLSLGGDATYGFRNEVPQVNRWKAKGKTEDEKKGLPTGG